jgi:hypothetical protein
LPRAQTMLARSCPGQDFKRPFGWLTWFPLSQAVVRGRAVNHGIRQDLRSATRPAGVHRTPSSQMYGGWWTKHRVDRICNHRRRQRRVWARMPACIAPSPWLASATVFSVYPIVSHIEFWWSLPGSLRPRGVVRRVCVVALLCQQAGSFLKERSAIVRATCRNLSADPRRSSIQRGPGQGRRPRAEATLLRSQRLGLGRGGTTTGQFQ